ncbi:beta/gamma crystallin domain-containing protein [Psychromicrobium sp. YIM B11713]|uniref:beta/gamma crystallin domain-containing protein n=1 Tax=Psychromicrobium sp. YIM B11713 TaxID=3145233 RepID=UPI00374FD118
MKFNIQNALRKTLIVSAVGAAVLVTLPVGTSTANASEVNCTDGNFVHLYWHAVGGLSSGTACYAGAGTNKVNSVWVDRITTGNNSITYHSTNGANVNLPKYYDISYPNNPPKVDSLTIH